MCLHNVQIHKAEFHGLCHEIIGRNSINGGLWVMRTRMRSSRAKPQSHSAQTHPSMGRLVALPPRF